MAGKKTKGGIEDLKAFLNEVIEDITDEDENPVFRELGTKNEKKNIDMDELRQIRKEISESIKDLEDPIKQSKPSTSEEVDTLARIDKMINAGKQEIHKIAKIKEAAVPADPVDKRVEVVEVFEEKLIAKLGSKAHDSAKSIKYLDDSINQSTPSTFEEVDTLARIDQMINDGKPEIQKIAKITEAAVPAEPVDERVEVVEVFEEKLIAKLGSKVQDSAKVDDIGEIKEEKDAIIDSQKATIITSGSGVNNELSENSQDDTGGNVDENNNDFMMVAVMAAAAAFVVLFLKIML
eukprot:GFUD01033652.1.p1 GENE.GFUD01033652.1~~GFUD01033652.1.p1  ORF type:complete len:308 (+),score=106.65 GFUD01033652.1:48-926(+)